MAALEQYYIEPDMLEILKTVAVEITKSVAGFSASCQFGQIDVTLTQPGCQAQFQNGGLQSQILGFLRSEFL